MPLLPADAATADLGWDDQGHWQVSGELRLWQLSVQGDDLVLRFDNYDTENRRSFRVAFPTVAVETALAK